MSLLPLSGYSGHGRTCYLLDPVAIDPKRTSVDVNQRERSSTSIRRVVTAVIKRAGEFQSRELPWNWPRGFSIKSLTLSSVSTTRERSFAGTPPVPCCLAFLPRRRSAKVSTSSYPSIFELHIGAASTLRWQRALRSFTAARHSHVPYTRADAGCTSK